MLCYTGNYRVNSGCVQSMIDGERRFPGETEVRIRRLGRYYEAKCQSG